MNTLCLNNGEGTSHRLCVCTLTLCVSFNGVLQFCFFFVLAKLLKSSLNVILVNVCTKPTINLENRASQEISKLFPKCRYSAIGLQREACDL